MTLGSKTYTAYNITSLNAFGYRSYYYDCDLELYYLINRYYDSNVGRFISPDDTQYLDFESLFGHNRYAYCANNPVMGYDPEGTWDWGNFKGWILTGLIAVAAVASIVVVAAGTVASGGALAAALVGFGVGALVSMGTSAAIQASQVGIENIDSVTVARSGAIGGAVGAVAGFGSWVVGGIASQIGQTLGFALSNTVHISSGIIIGQAIDAVTLMSVGGFVGNIVGGLIGGTVANYIANKVITGKGMDFNEIMESGVQGEIPLWIIRFFRWLFA